MILEKSSFFNFKRKDSLKILVDFVSNETESLKNDLIQKEKISLSKEIFFDAHVIFSSTVENDICILKEKLIF